MIRHGIGDVKSHGNLRTKSVFSNIVECSAIVYYSIVATINILCDYLTIGTCDSKIYYSNVVKHKQDH